MGQLPLLDPDPDRAPRVVAGDEVHAEPDHLRDVEAAVHGADDLLRRAGSGHDIEVGRPHRGPLTQGPAGVAGGGEAQLPPSVGVQQIARQDAVLDHDSAPRGEPLPIEGPRAQSARHPTVVHDEAPNLAWLGSAGAGAGAGNARPALLR